ncbi:MULTISPECIES: TetR/AcrR family transcriptional regulator [unclassified Pseudonocardia]|jgi:AcrR family transcriptional regulator|uniref:TetR/AcrR family transcriptional regulator n=1 Tax=unclassified Pseudonocardia TaxID=2619320 RepID=UPI000961B88C|nr:MULTISPECIES: TetR/AcrR family transcriptional regulator [unclassified Pseudonocardia]MBN9100938.1 TetR family transcriptional regulator [Pseudonocardia sp.]OJY39403.1 MAG: TetR family transcriptional regulator [Pseudonocardia sp. 73-21]
MAATVSKSARTRERILDAAAEVLNRKGYAGTRLSDIAEVAQLQAPAIYYYFPSRDDVIQEVVQVGLRRTMAHVEASLAALPSGVARMERILVAVAAHLEVVLQDSAYSSAAIRNAAQLPQAIRDVQLLDERRYGALWRTLIDDAVAAGEVNPDLDPRAARMLVIGALNWAPEWWDAGRGTLADTVRTAQLIVRNGLKMEESAP